MIRTLNIKQKITTYKHRTIFVGMPLEYYDFENGLWYKATIEQINVQNQTALIQCSGGENWWESKSELQDIKAYRFNHGK